jgi:hypothetical protein
MAKEASLSRRYSRPARLCQAWIGRRGANQALALIVLLSVSEGRQAGRRDTPAAVWPRTALGAPTTETQQNPGALQIPAQSRKREILDEIDVAAASQREPHASLNRFSSDFVSFDRYFRRRWSGQHPEQWRF